MVVFFLTLSLLFQQKDLITVQLERQYYDNSERVGISYFSIEEDSFFVKESISRCLTGYRFISDKENYGEHSPVAINILENNFIQISFDDNFDGIYNDRDTLFAKFGTRTRTSLKFKHKKDEAKNLEIKCDIEVDFEQDKYILRVYYFTILNGTLHLDNEKYSISYWESMDKLDLKINNDYVRQGNPLRFGKSFYRIKSINPFLKTIHFERVSPGTRLYGTRVGLYINNTQLENSFKKHNVDLSAVLKHDLSVFYFWGHWCGPCIKKMPETSKLFNDLQDKINVINISYLLNEMNPIEEMLIVDEIINNYNLPGFHIKESYKKNEESQPLVNLFDNRFYPNYIVLDSELKILFIEGESDTLIEEFLSDLLK